MAAFQSDIFAANPLMDAVRMSFSLARVRATYRTLSSSPMQSRLIFSAISSRLSVVELTLDTVSK